VATQTTNKESALDLALAARLQAALLPKKCPSDYAHQVATARNRMCGSVGGDFYDFLRINEEQIALVIGDVVGHGVRAALVMAQIMGYLRFGPPALARPREIITALNRMLIDLGERIGGVMSCSLFYAVIDAPTGISFFVNAGHPRPFICDNGKCIVLHPEPGNLLLGVEEFEPVESCHTFTPPQRLILYTDGLIDAANSDGEHFGLNRLHEVLNDCASRDPDYCVDTVFETVEKFRGNSAQIDDETIVAIDRI
jgi:serine phosphatase RsbU (regulator of sigma subunit)